MESTSRRRWWHTPTLFLAMADRATGAVYTFHNSELGTPELMTDSTNTVVWEGISKPFGETAVNSGSISATIPVPRNSPAGTPNWGQLP